MVVAAAMVVMVEGGWGTGANDWCGARLLHYKQPIIAQLEEGREQERERREEERDSERDRKREREDEERSSIQLIKVEDTGISLHWRFLSTCRTSFSFPPFPFLFFPCTSRPLTTYFAVKIAGVGALKGCFNGCWQGVDKQKPKPEDLLEKIQSDMFSLRLIGGLRGGGMAGMWGWRDWWGRCEWVWLFWMPPPPPPTLSPFPLTPPCFPLSFWAIVWKCPLNYAKEQTRPALPLPPPPPRELWVLFQGGGMWWAREQDYTTLIESDLPLLVSDTHSRVRW